MEIVARKNEIELLDSIVGGVTMDGPALLGKGEERAASFC